ncbi:hypothetical protein ABK040_000097 [Willaertia magna]
MKSYEGTCFDDSIASRNCHSNGIETNIESNTNNNSNARRGKIKKNTSQLEFPPLFKVCMYNTVRKNRKPQQQLEEEKSKTTKTLIERIKSQPTFKQKEGMTLFEFEEDEILVRKHYLLDSNKKDYLLSKPKILEDEQEFCKVNSKISNP